MSRRASSNFRWLDAALAGIVAGAAATIFQVGCWWLAGEPAIELLFRDARLTAAIVLGPRVLPPPSTSDTPIFGVATLVHFALSTAYGLALCGLLLPAGERFGRFWRMVVGAAFGLILYAGNMYGFTIVFPWFAVVRDGITLATHVVFGVAVVVAYRIEVSATAG